VEHLQDLLLDQELEELRSGAAVVLDLARVAARRRLREVVHLGLRPGLAGTAGLDAGQAGESGSATTVLALSEPPARGESRRIEGDGAAAEIVAFLEEKRLV